MLKVCLIIAIVAGLAAGILTVTKVQDIIVTTRTDRDDWAKKDKDEVLAHNKTKKTLKETGEKLAATQKTLDQTKGELDAANTSIETLTKEKTDLTAKLDKTTSQYEEDEQKLEVWRALGLTPDQVRENVANLAKSRKEIAALIGENRILMAKTNEWQDRWNAFFPNADPLLPVGLHGKIVAVDPKFNFVVLNIGSDQGAKQLGVMMVDRDGKLLGKVRISSVTKTECIANIMPDWKRGNIMEGDEVLY
jgi:vacuolar-type H+-ATPase subunit I/STV1